MSDDTTPPVAPADQESPQTLLDHLYGDLNGYDSTDAEESVVVESKSSAMYGEILPTSTTELLDYLNLNEDDVLFDLGSGTGKFIMQAALTTKIRRCVGIELVQRRHFAAQAVLQVAGYEGRLQTQDVEFLCEDFMEAALEGATIIYTCSTAFPQALLQNLARRMSDLPSNTIFVTLQDLDETPWFLLEDVLALDMSWGKSRAVHIYRRV